MLITNNIQIKKNFYKNLIIHFISLKDIKKFSSFIKKNLLKKEDIYIESYTNILNLKSKNCSQIKIKSFFNKKDFEKYKKYWLDMPNYNQENLTPYKSIIIYFKTKNGFEYFKEVLKIKITDKTKYIYYPKATKTSLLSHIWKGSPILLPKYPIYIISKGRWESRYTSKTLELMKVPYYIVIEPQEYKQYSKVINKKKIKVLPFSNLGQGSIPARNWVWEDAIKNGFEKHWILDDNIQYFYRMQNNQVYRIFCSNLFYIIENFVDRFENIAIAGMHYRYFFPKKTTKPPFYLNTRVYSNLLINNSLPFRWRGKFNEDTDLCLRVLKNNYCTILFNNFLAGKITTMVMKGGNTDELYKNTDKRKEFAKSLINQHPDIVKMVWRYNRWHHQVDYSKFKNIKLIYKKGVEEKLNKENNEYGLYLIKKRGHL